MQGLRTSDIAEDNRIGNMGMDYLLAAEGSEEAKARIRARLEEQVARIPHASTFSQAARQELARKERVKQSQHAEPPNDAPPMFAEPEDRTHSEEVYLSGQAHPRLHPG